MKRRYVVAFLGGLLMSPLLASGCTTANTATESSESPKSSTLLVAAAASLQEALNQIDPLFKAAHPGITINYNFAASGALQQQIEQGAPVDVFISAAAKQMDALQAKALILAETRHDLLTNRLALVVPVDSQLNLTDFRQLTEANVKKISIGEVRSVPAGQYAAAVFQDLGISQQLQPKLVYGNSVRSVLGTVESGNADAGIVYQTDAKSKRVKQVAIAPEDSHKPSVYPVAIVKASHQVDAAHDYIQFLSSDQAKAVFQKYGFGIK